MPITLERIPHDKQVQVRTLSMFGTPYRTIAKLVGIGKDAIISINRQFPSNTDEIDQCKKRMIGEAYGLTARSWLRVTDDKLDAMNALQLTTIGAIGVDKARDMEGSNRPVVNIVTMVGDLSSRLTDIKHKQQALEAFEASQ
jgi:hypothetical protein